MSNETVAEHLTLDEINDDCLELIFEYITDLPTQLRVANVCTHFRDIIIRIWRRKPIYKTICLDALMYLIPRPQDLTMFLRAMQNHLYEIKIMDKCLSEFIKNLEKFGGISHLPRVERCIIYDWIKMNKFLDCDIFRLQQVMPNLKYLHVTGPISGNFLTNFQLLEELYLFDELNLHGQKYEISDIYLKELFETLPNLRALDIRAFHSSTLQLMSVDKCEKLEVLKLNLNALSPVLDQVLELPNLHMLTVRVDCERYYCTDEFYQILQMRSDRITSIGVDNNCMGLLTDWDNDLGLLQYQKLQKFAFTDWLYDEDMLWKYCQMTELTVLNCCNWRNLTNDTVLDFVKYCPKLIHLNVKYCLMLTDTLLYDIMEVFHRQDRETPLFVEFRRSGMELNVLRNLEYWQSQTLIHISEEFGLSSYSIDNRGYEFEFE